MLQGIASYAQAESASLKNLKVEYMTNPVGLDMPHPRFSWQLDAQQRGSKQTAYLLRVSTDAAGNNEVWSSGKVASDASVHIPYDGAPLLPSTRYYWRVTVTDNNLAEITSSETAYFETALADWGGAQWIKATSVAQGDVVADDDDLSGITEYTLSVDFEIASASAGICFGKEDDGNFYMWQINLEQATPRLRPHSWSGGNPTCHENKNLAVTINKNTVYNFRLEVSGKVAKTYIDNVLVDERTSPLNKNYGLGSIGFRAQGEPTVTENALFDNVALSTPSGVLLQADFEALNPFSGGGTLESGRLRMRANGTELRSWWENVQKPTDKFTVEMDVTLIKANVGILFSAKDANNTHMWAINTFGDNQTLAAPILRRHVWKSGAVTYSDKALPGYAVADFVNRERAIRIEVDSDVIKTYIDGALVDTYTDVSNQLFDGYVGFRVHRIGGEQAYYDNVKVTSYKNGVGTVSFAEDFESSSHQYEGATVVVGGNTKINVVADVVEEVRMLPNSALSAPMFRREFTAAKTIKSAKIYSSALGVYDLFINGQRVGSREANGTVIYDELKPGWTDYTKTIHYMTYDVTSLLTTGANVIGAYVTSGWWAGGVSHGKYPNPELGFIAKLDIEYSDGSTESIVTNRDWLSSTSGPIILGDIYDGEKYDARHESSWTVAGYPTAGWHQTTINRRFFGEIRPFVGPAVRVRPELERTPASIAVYEGTTSTGTTYGMVNTLRTLTGNVPLQLKKGETAVYDLGQNMVGWVKLRVLGDAGTNIRFRFAEMLNDNGAASRGNDGPGGSAYVANLRSAKATLNYILKGDAGGETYHPSMTFFGFRYCELTATGDVEIASLVGEVVGSVTEEGSTLVTSNPLVNQLYSNVKWGQRGNFLSVPTDCPQRDERLGWTGDAQIFARAAAYNADVASFFRKWMRDMRDSQDDDGSYPNVAPHSWTGKNEFGNSAWSDAGIIVPWTIYLMYADKSIIDENYVSMTAYMNWEANQHFDGVTHSGGTTTYGDWLEYANPGTDRRYMAMCYYAYITQLMAKMAAVLGKEADVTKYNALYAAIKTEFQNKYKTPASTTTTQAAYLLSLKVGFAPDYDAAVAALAKKIKDNGSKLSTGFVGTGTLNQTLSAVGLTSTAYDLLLQRNNPSWLYSVDQGATTIWERWNSYTTATGFGDVSMNSFNHYAYGAVSEWMYRFMAGIETDEANPGFKHIILQPSPDVRTTFPTGEERLTSVDASHHSYYGLIRSAWAMQDDGRIAYQTTIPANTTATLYLPLLTATDQVYEGNKPVAEAEGITFIKTEDGTAIFTLQSGQYSFTIRSKPDDPPTAVPTASAPLHIYPNPLSNGQFTIEGLQKGDKVEIYSLSGQRVALYELLTGEATTLYLSHLAVGTYVVRAGGKVAKIVKE
jgi:alpha-L-rhamnosidase